VQRADFHHQIAARSCFAKETAIDIFKIEARTDGKLHSQLASFNCIKGTGNEKVLMNYNNDRTTTFPDIQEVLRITESLISLRLKASGNSQEVRKQAIQHPPGSTSMSFILRRLILFDE